MKITWEIRVKLHNYRINGNRYRIFLPPCIITKYIYVVTLNLSVLFFFLYPNLGCSKNIERWVKCNPNSKTVHFWCGNHVFNCMIAELASYSERLSAFIYIMSWPRFFYDVERIETKEELPWIRVVTEKISSNWWPTPPLF
jgi:hypothetical protein